MEPGMSVIEPGVSVMEPGTGKKTQEKPKEIIYATATGETNYSPTTHDFKDPTYDHLTSYYNDESV
jgi:hypothetical protein